MECKYEYQIERLRKQLIEVAQQEGLHSESTITLSRELDILINRYEKHKKQNLFQRNS